MLLIVIWWHTGYVDRAESCTTHALIWNFSWTAICCIGSFLQFSASINEVEFPKKQSKSEHGLFELKLQYHHSSVLLIHEWRPAMCTQIPCFLRNDTIKWSTILYSSIPRYIRPYIHRRMALTPCEQLLFLGISKFVIFWKQLKYTQYNFPDSNFVSLLDNAKQW